MLWHASAWCKCAIVKLNWNICARESNLFRLKLFKIIITFQLCGKKKIRWNSLSLQASARPKCLHLITDRSIAIVHNALVPQSIDPMACDIIVARRCRRYGRKSASSRRAYNFCLPDRPATFQLLLLFFLKRVSEFSVRGYISHFQRVVKSRGYNYYTKYIAVRERR